MFCNVSNIKFIFVLQQLTDAQRSELISKMSRFSVGSESSDSCFEYKGFSTIYSRCLRQCAIALDYTIISKAVPLKLLSPCDKTCPSPLDEKNNLISFGKTQVVC